VNSAVRKLLAWPWMVINDGVSMGWVNVSGLFAHRRFWSRHAKCMCNIDSVHGSTQTAPSGESLKNGLNCVITFSRGTEWGGLCCRWTDGLMVNGAGQQTKGRGKGLDECKPPKVV
jgi:hypothetical protein